MPAQHLTRPTRPWRRALAGVAAGLLLSAGLLGGEGGAPARADTPESPDAIPTTLINSYPGHYEYAALAPVGPGDTVQVLDPGDGCGWSAKQYVWLNFAGDSAAFPLSATAESWCTYLIPADQATPADWTPGTTVQLVFSNNPHYSEVAAGAFSQIVWFDSSAGYGSVGAGWTGVAAPPTIPSTFASAAAPTITGTAKVGATLTANPGAFVPAATGYSYQWQIGSEQPPGAAAATYTIGEADAGKPIRVLVTGTKDGYDPVTTTSAAVVVNRTLTSAPTPTISGTAKVGSVLTAAAGKWTPAPVTLRYQWKRSGVAIAGATASTYTLVAGDAAARITVVVTGTRTGYSTVAKTSAATAAVKAKTLTAAPVPKIAGTAKVGKTLSASAGRWTPAPVTLTYQWKRSGVAIAGATKSSYKLVALDKGKKVTVVVKGAKAGFASVSKTSAATAIIK